MHQHWQSFRLQLLKDLVLELTGKQFYLSEHNFWEGICIWPTIHFPWQRLMHLLRSTILSSLKWYASSANFRIYLKCTKNAPALAEFQISTPKRPGAGANWEAVLPFREQFLGRYLYLAYNTLSLAEIDAPVTEHYFVFPKMLRFKCQF